MSTLNNNRQPINISSGVTLLLFLLAMSVNVTPQFIGNENCFVGSGVDIIVNKNIALTKLTTKDLKYFFLGKKTMWAKGGKVTIILQKSGKAHKAFLKAYIGKSSAKYRNYWRKLAFTGKASIPQSFSRDADVIKKVAKTPGAIGYITSQVTRSNKVKVITIQ